MSGECPGVVDYLATGLTPSRPFGLVTGTLEGSAVVPAGTCAGTVVDLTAQSAEVFGADRSGCRAPAPRIVVAGPRGAGPAQSDILGP